MQKECHPDTESIKGCNLISVLGFGRYDLGAETKGFLFARNRHGECLNSGNSRGIPRPFPRIARARIGNTGSLPAQSSRPFEGHSVSAGGRAGNMVVAATCCLSENPALAIVSVYEGV